MPVDHSRKTISYFAGLYGRDDFDGSVPEDHFVDCLNIRFDGEAIVTRPGVSTHTGYTGVVKRIALYKRTGEATRLLILDDTGKLFDSTNLGSPILNIASMVDFSLFVMYNRAYITPHNRVTGLAGEKVYVYNGSGTARAAAGIAPTGTLNVAESASAGKIEAGTHLIAVSFETDSGFITPPGPENFAILTATGGFKADVTGIPTGPSFVQARHLIATKRIQGTYNGNQLGYNLYLALRIANNVDTTAELDFFDADLISSADYLLDQLDEIPAGLGMTAYRNRLISWGEANNPNLIRASKIGEPESISELDGIVTVDPSESDTIKNCAEFRNQLCIYKSRRTSVTQDNGAEPSTWNVDSLDPGIGTEVFGISKVIDKEGGSKDKLLTASIHGLMHFTGVYDEIELSWKIHKFWHRINREYFNLVQVYIEPFEERIYISVPLDAATECSHIFIGDYHNGLNAKDIRWTIDRYHKPNTSFLIDLNLTTKKPTLVFGSSANGVFKLDDTVTNDVNNAIDSYFETYMHRQVPDAKNHFGHVGFQGNGSGFLDITVRDEAGKTANLPSYTLTSIIREPTIICNFVANRMATKFRVSSIDEYFKIREVYLYAKALWTGK